MKILTNFVHPPIPDRRWDWEAWVDGQEEGRIGRGSNRKEAVSDLLQQLEPKDIPHHFEETSAHHEACCRYYGCDRGAGHRLHVFPLEVA